MKVPVTLRGPCSKIATAGSSLDSNSTDQRPASRAPPRAVLPWPGKRGLAPWVAWNGIVRASPSPRSRVHSPSSRTPPWVMSASIQLS